MKISYSIMFVGMTCLQTIAPKSSAIVDFTQDVLSTIVDTLGEGISITQTFDKTLRTGFKIHSAITGQNSFAKLNGPLDSNFKSEIQQAYTKHTQQDAQVRVSTQLCEQEKTFVEQRLSLAQTSFQALCGDYGISVSNLTSSNMPRVAIVASGGGCRAMLATAAFYEVLEGITDVSGAKLLDVVLYAAALSGSTWATVMRAFGIPEQQCFNAYEKYIQFNPDALSSAAKSRHAQLPALPAADEELKISPTDNQALVVSNKASVSGSLSLMECLNFSKNVDPAKSYLLPSSKPDSQNNLYDEMSYIQQMIMLKFYGDQNINAMSPYGAFISHMIAAPFDDPSINNGNTYNYYPQPRQRLFFSQTATYLESNNCGNFPLPLCSAVAPKKQDNFLKRIIKKFTREDAQEAFLWFEFSPYEVGTLYNKTTQGAFVPTWAFGRQFYKVPQYETVKESVIKDVTYGAVTQRGGSAGINARSSVTIPHSIVKLVKRPKGMIISSNSRTDGSAVAPYTYISEYPLGDLLATFGSAFAVSPANVVQLMGIGDISENHPYLARVMKAMSQALQFTPVGSTLGQAYNNFRLFPFSTSNFLKWVDGSPCTDSDIVLIDAGLAFNVPFPLALRPERKIDVIIALDASGPTYTVDSHGKPRVDALVGAQEWAKRNNVPFPEVLNDPLYQKIMTVDGKGCAPQDIFIFKGTGTTPTIIYIPFQDNTSNKDSSFRVAQCLQGECNTFNFGYRAATIENVKKHIYNTIHNGDNIQQILQAIADKIGARG